MINKWEEKKKKKGKGSLCYYQCKKFFLPFFCPELGIQVHSWHCFVCQIGVSTSVAPFLWLFFPWTGENSGLAEWVSRAEVFRGVEHSHAVYTHNNKETFPLFLLNMPSELVWVIQLMLSYPRGWKEMVYLQPFSVGARAWAGPFPWLLLLNPRRRTNSHRANGIGLVVCALTSSRKPQTPSLF